MTIAKAITTQRPPAESSGRNNVSRPLSKRQRAIKKPVAALTASVEKPHGIYGTRALADDALGGRQGTL